MDVADLVPSLGLAARKVVIGSITAELSGVIQPRHEMTLLRLAGDVVFCLSRDR